MDWWTNVLEGSSSRGHYPGRHGEDRYWDEPRRSVDDLLNFDNEEIEYAIALSLSEEDQKGKKVIEEDNESEQSEEYYKPHQPEEDVTAQLEEDEQLAKTIQESLSLESPPRARYDGGNLVPPYPFSSGYRICAGCNTEIGHGQFLSCMGGVWHPDCFCCNACNLPITDYEFSVSGNRRYHESCYRKKDHPRCDVCNKFPRDTRYISLDDGRKLCLECLDSAIMDTHECQPLYFEIRKFYEGLNMKVEQEIPLLLVERPALNEAMEGEKNGHHHLPETRGLCLSEEQTVPTVWRWPRNGAGNRFIDIRIELSRLSRRCEVAAILILYGLPRLLTGSILAHEMMHAWLRLKGYPNLRPEVEEGICQVLAHMWLDSEIYSSSGGEGASSSSSSSPPSSSTSSKKGPRSDFEKKLGEFFKHQIESDTSPDYGEGFMIGNQAVLKHGLRRTLDHIQMTGTFPV
ncbi:protein DA1-related 1-like isoform X2 [Populus nigra]|uniref:protein DA1-related 1-like isoform X2 n=1 Tax=Populus nigra TaxID=3691 RepID=UPI002B278B66|nr:protein DA1-related 1-like isoform X2 [Populus nigra]